MACFSRNFEKSGHLRYACIGSFVPFGALEGDGLGWRSQQISKLCSAEMSWNGQGLNSKPLGIRRRH